MSAENSFNFDDWIVEDSQPENAPPTIKKRRFFEKKSPQAEQQQAQQVMHNSYIHHMQFDQPQQQQLIQPQTHQPFIPCYQPQLSEGNRTQPQAQHSTPTHQTPEFNDEFLRTLREIARNQIELKNQMQVLQTTQTSIMETVASVINGVSAITKNQIAIVQNLEAHDQNSANKSEMLAQNALLRECKVVAEHIQRSVCLMTGEIRDSALDEIASLLPLQSLEVLFEVEEKLSNADFVQNMITYIHRIKGASTEVDCVLRHIFADSLLDGFNWDGRGGVKRALGNLTLVDPVLRGVFEKGALHFEKDVRAALTKSHHRTTQQKYVQKKK
ncbi:uncharacterized protein [Eurosta solidaginis]|uniref:uncharacterized protein n=1 Tax=Eurosta solidaginis TaxID=178769 RepID=UPI003530A7DA